MEKPNIHLDLFELYPLATAVTDMNMDRIFYVNNKFCELVRRNREEILGKSSTKLGLFSENDRGKFTPVLNVDGELRGHEKAFTTDDGAVTNTRIFSRLITKGKESYVLSIFCNVTDRKHTEQPGLKEKNNKAISTLASGIAHEFNNALAGITGSIELLRMELSGNEQVEKYGEVIMASAQRMTATTKQLLAYSRQGKYREETLSLSDVTKNLLPVLRRSINPSIRIDTNLSRTIPLVMADNTQIQMILSSVLANASEASDTTGSIMISTQEVMVDATGPIINPEVQPGRYVCLTIEDQGKGMDRETRNRIFEPFFSTKFQGRGLGMAAVYGIVKNHGGWIHVESQPSRGTQVAIYLPAVEAAGIKKEKIPETTSAMGTETILIIEDKSIVRDISRAMLEKLGFHVLEARTGKEAIEIAETYPGDIDLALLDIILPDMGGDTIFPRIKRSRPDLKIVICSGYEIDGPVQDLLDAGAEDFIRKPFTFATLSAVVMALVERRKNNRFKVARGVFAIPKTNDSKQGQVIDISRGGLAFFAHNGEDFTRKLAKLAISMSSELFYLDKIPCKIISHHVANALFSKRHKKMKRIGLQFGKLTQAQSDQLEHFLQNLTTSPV